MLYENTRELHVGAIAENYACWCTRAVGVHACECANNSLLVSKIHAYQVRDGLCEFDVGFVIIEAQLLPML